MKWIKSKQFKKGEGSIYPFGSTRIDLPGVKKGDTQIAYNGRGVDICIESEATYQLTLDEIINDFVQKHEYLKTLKVTEREKKK
jgi:hypothetical protein